MVAFLLFVALAKVVSAAGLGPEALANIWSGKPAKYVFLFIGDGMGLQQISAAEIYSGSINGGGTVPHLKKLSFTQFEGQGMSTTYSANGFITDSASAATALATGYKTDKGVVGMDSEKKKRFFSVADSARENGMKVGIVSSVSINHATPAAFYAFVPSRSDYYDIGMQLIESGVDYFGGGGFYRDRGKNKDKKSLYAIAAEKGIAVLRDRQSIMNRRSGGGRVFAVNPILDSGSAMPYAIDRTEQEVSLAELTRKGIELLDNPGGFFMHVEGGKIDWACHANDAATSIHDVFAFDEAVREALAFAKRRPDETLIVVVGDHETGGMSIGFAGTEYRTFFEKIAGQKESYLAFDRKIAECRKAKRSFRDFLPAITESFGLLHLSGSEVESLKQAAEKGDEEAARRLSMNLSALELRELERAFRQSMIPGKDRVKSKELFLLYGGYEPLSVQVTHILNNKAGIGWTTYAHTGVPVPVYAHGVGAGIFNGYYDNTDVAWKILSVMGMKAKAPVRVH